MTIPSILWYLCALFLVAAVVTSLIDVVPGGETEIRAMMTVCGGLSMAFGVAAGAMKKRGLGGPQWLLRGLQCVAVFLTLFILFSMVS